MICDICRKEFEPKDELDRNWAEHFDFDGINLTVCGLCREKYHESERKRAIETFKKLIQ